MKFHVCDVTSPLASVHRIAEAGHPVISNPSWDQRGSYIQHQETNEKMKLTAQDGVYVLETKVAPNNLQMSPGFATQGL